VADANQVEGEGSVLISHLVQFLCPEPVLVMNDMVVRRAVGSLNSHMAVQEEVILKWVADFRVHQHTCKVE
jgi:hypothetical protein